MRTLLLVLLMLAVALAAGLGLVLPAGAQATGPTTLEARRGPPGCPVPVVTSREPGPGPSGSGRRPLRGAPLATVGGLCLAMAASGRRAPPRRGGTGATRHSGGDH